ncbi:ABC transporter substrate-binding protein [Microbacterium gorillae]|uniref:ABC transporter substrate-binding protein n=1 Tax=Microbacterium gorillae TaxID=1231063 RepID=UPI00058F3CF6|nr:ABC transporter substrate-binding protein [Microbacterium gorillae]
MTRLARRATIPTLFVATALALSGCATSASTAAPTATSASPTATEAAAAFPRTVSVPAGATTAATEVTIQAEPQRIAALSYESAALAAELGLTDRLVMVPAEASNPALTDHADAFADVDATIATTSKIDPEAVFAQHPDLVILTARHGQEDSAGAALQALGVPVLVLPNAWSTPDQVAADIALVGEATGADDQAATLADELTTALAGDDEPAADAPRVLVLNNQAGRPFVTAGTAFPLEMLRLAGAQDVSAELGLKTTGPITAEQIIDANPDAILMIDMNGSGEASFASLLKNPAVAGLPAVTDGRTHLVLGKNVQALGLSSTPAGLADLKTWVGSL